MSDRPALSAVIDVGTNTIRLLIGYIKDGKTVRIATSRAVTRLGKDLLSTKHLLEENMLSSIHSIAKFKKIYENYGVKDIVAVGTSALRDAKNSDIFLKNVIKETGIDIRIISGIEEAELTLRGILGCSENILIKPLVIVDIGGGSTEWIYSNAVDIKDSVQVGAVKLHESFIKHDPPEHNELKQIRAFISESFYSSLSCRNIDLNKSVLESRVTLVATGGTATTAAAVDLGLDEYDGDTVHMHKLALPSLKKIFDSLISMPLKERVNIKGLERERADIIIPGIMILITALELLNTDSVTVSDYGILEGILCTRNFQ